jgi:hypothetical protein
MENNWTQETGNAKLIVELHHLSPSLSVIGVIKLHMWKSRDTHSILVRKTEKEEADEEVV